MLVCTPSIIKEIHLHLGTYELNINKIIACTENKNERDKIDVHWAKRKLYCKVRMIFFVRQNLNTGYLVSFRNDQQVRGKQIMCHIRARCIIIDWRDNKES